MWNTKISYLVRVPYVRVLYPNFCEQTAHVWLEQNLVAVTGGILFYSNLLVILPI